MNQVIILLLLLNVCHWIADYTHASRPWMLQAKRLGKPWPPIAAHAAVHALLMGLVCWGIVGPQAGIAAALIQLPTHFVIDVLKGRANGWFPPLQNPANPFHWWVFGADQFAHQAVIIAIAFLVGHALPQLPPRSIEPIQPTTHLFIL